MPPLLLAVLLAADPDPAKALEDRMTRAIAAAEGGVAAVVVSHRKYPTDPPADQPWQLGRYAPPAEQFGLPRRAGLQQVNRNNPLDLSAPHAAADNTFGSGLVLSADGLVLTAAHLVADATKVFVRTPTGGSYADLVAADDRADLAVLRLLDVPPKLRPVKLAEVRVGRGANGEAPTVRRGQWVIALGHPLAAGFADGAPSASWGILSNLRRRLTSAGTAGEGNTARPLASYSTLLQTDARVTLGCSGGGLFDLDGAALARTSSTAGLTGADTAGGYALPFDRNVRRVIDALKDGREVEYGFLGVRLYGGIGFDRTVGAGVVLSSVTPGMPADLAGLRPNDRVVAVDGQPVVEPDDLFLHVGAALAGTRVAVRFVRDGETQEATADLAKHAHDLKRVASRKRPAAFGLRPEWGSVRLVKHGSVELGQPAGVVVAELEPNSPAEGKLKPLGDVAGRWLVTAADSTPTPTPAAFEAATAGKLTVRFTLLDPAGRGRTHQVVLP